MLIRLWNHLARWFLIAGLVSLIGLALARAIVLLYGRTRIFTAKEVPAHRVAIVFGAGLRRDGTPTLVLRDRVQTAASLYFAGKVEKLLMSGDNRFVYYNEPESMRRYALSLGVPDDAIVLDYAGRRTYDTCYRARHIFGLKSAILVTQGFHLPRALFLCNRLGVTAVGVPADLSSYRKVSRAVWTAREWIATLAAFFDLLQRKPAQVLGNPEPIFPEAP